MADPLTGAGDPLPGAEASVEVNRQPGPILVTGASGYVGGRLIRVLAERGREVRGMSRHPEYLAPRLPMGAEAVGGDAPDRELAETRWNDALACGAGSGGYGGERFGLRRVDSRAATVDVPPTKAFEPIRRIGGETGWYRGNWLWRLRGFLELLMGGVGIRRGRRDPDHLVLGDAVDFWRVEAIEDDRLLRLHAEMKLPGRAWLQFEVDGDDSISTIRQTAIFDPVGLAGLAYWYGVYPLHSMVFGGLLRSIAREAER